MRQQSDDDEPIRQSFIDSNHKFRFKPFKTRIKPEFKVTSADVKWLLDSADSDDDDDSSDDDGSVDAERVKGKVAVDEDGWPVSASAEVDAPKPHPVMPKPNAIRNVGIQVAFTKQAGPAAIALCSDEHVLLVTDILKPKNSDVKASSAFRDAFREQLLEGELYFTAFGAHEVALTVYKDTGILLERLFNLLDHPKPDARPSHVATVRDAFGSDAKIFEDLINKAFVKREFKFARGREGKAYAFDLAKEAWLAFAVGKQLRANSALLEIAPINLTKFDDTPDILDEQVASMSTLIMAAIEEPDKQDIKFKSADLHGGRASIQQTAYNARVRRGSRQTIQGCTSDNTRFKGEVGKIDGKRATLRIPQTQGMRDPKLVGVTVRGKADPTQADARRSSDILQILQLKKSVEKEPWYYTLFPPRRRDTKQSKASPKSEPLLELDVPQGETQITTTTHSTESDSATVDIEGFIDLVDGESTEDSDDSLESRSHSKVKQEPKPVEDSYWKGWVDDSEGASWDPEPVPQTDVPGTTLAPPSESYKRKSNSHDSWGAWDDAAAAAPPEAPKKKNFVRVSFKSSRLNGSQLNAVRDVLNFDKKVSIIKGPPGTGKTTVISAVLSSLLADKDSSHHGYIITQSNVGAKNIAEKLVKSGIQEWVLIVAGEFMHDWHNHIYANIPQEYIFIPEGKKQAPHRRFTLCTLSMLSNQQVLKRSQQVPMNFLLVDEASQIPMPHYNVIIHSYSGTLQKIGFIGDNHQLPPHHNDKSTDFNSVFEHTPLLAKEGIILLDKQYRMPPQIGGFISQHVYEGELCSWEQHPVQERLSCQFIDVLDSKEMFDRATSGTKNEAEADASVQIASILSQSELSFKIITPYDAQKDLIEAKLKESDICWENTVYTVDSFQGNEDDYIIISAVRTLAPGFMRDLRRSNVMLSRAKKGMYICANVPFLNSPAAHQTLLATMAREWAGLEGGVIGSNDLDKSLIF